MKRGGMMEECERKTWSINQLRDEKEWRMREEEMDLESEGSGSIEGAYQKYSIGGG